MSAIKAFAHEFDRNRRLIEKAIAELDDETFFQPPGENVNSIALIVKHLAGNLRSRWSELLTSDGDKPWRDRDREFVLADDDSRASLMAAWDEAWGTVETTLAGLADADLERQITIRGEPHTVLQALIRGTSHAAYHAGQVLYIARMLNPGGTWLTIAPGKSREHGPGRYLKRG